MKMGHLQHIGIEYLSKLIYRFVRSTAYYAENKMDMLALRILK
nr:MAG TPA: hypothetical protein [Bacteriophage sp.]